MDREEGGSQLEEEENSQKKTKKPKAKYCAAINCSNNAKSLDPRTGQRVKMHKFPDPVRERDR
jgi:hypothetical protein